jgi:hypothetical protein
MRQALILSVGILIAVTGAGFSPASAAPGIVSGQSGAGRAVAPARLVHRPRVRHGGRRVMGLPTPGSRGRSQHLRVPRL